MLLLIFIHIAHLAPPMVVSLVEITLKQEKADARSTLAGKLNVGCSPLKSKNFESGKGGGHFMPIPPIWKVPPVGKVKVVR